MDSTRDGGNTSKEQENSTKSGKNGVSALSRKNPPEFPEQVFHARCWTDSIAELSNLQLHTAV